MTLTFDTAGLEAYQVNGIHAAISTLLFEKGVSHEGITDSGIGAVALKNPSKGFSISMQELLDKIEQQTEARRAAAEAEGTPPDEIL